GSDKGILEVQNAQPRETLATRQPQQVGRMEVAQHPGLRRLDGWRQRRGPKRAERRAGRIRDPQVEARQIPVEDELGLDQESLQVVGGDLIFELRRSAQPVGKLLIMERKERV